MSERNGGDYAIRAHDVWVRFWVQHVRTEYTLREAFVRMLRPRRDELGPNRKRAEFWALRGVNLNVRRGEILGLLGHNGAGKTTFLKTLAGICAPDRGVVDVRGRVGCLLSFGVGFNMNLSGRENVFLNGSILGMRRSEIRARIDEIIDFAELQEFIDAPVRTYSAGMRGRLGFAIAVHIDPDVLLIDEVLGVGDANFRAKAGDLLDRFVRAGKTVVVASHSLSLIRQRCTRALLVDHGEIRLEAEPQAVIDAYLAAAGASPDAPESDPVDATV